MKLRFSLLRFLDFRGVREVEKGHQFKGLLMSLVRPFDQQKSKVAVYHRLFKGRINANRQKPVVKTPDAKV